MLWRAIPTRRVWFPSLQMAELEKRLAELEMAVGSGSDKQVHTRTHAHTQRTDKC